MEINKVIAKKELEVFGGIPNVTRYWNDGKNRSIDILTCENRPYDGVNSYATIGLSQIDIGIHSDGKPLRVELVGACDTKEKNFIETLTLIAFEIMKRGQCKYGQLIKDAIMPLELISDMKHVYFMEPYVWDEFKTIEFEGYNVTWLLVIPISDGEIDYAIKNGTDALESLLEKHNIDIFNLKRKSVI